MNVCAILSLKRGGGAAMDATDREILRLLNKNGRATASEISREIHLSIPAVAERIRKLDEADVIENYTVRISREKAGWNIMAFIHVSVDDTENIANFRAEITKYPCVLECHHVAGTYDYLLKVLTENMAALDFFLSNSLKTIQGVRSSNTTIVLSTLKETLNPF